MEKKIKILIIKLGALGDVIRTLPIAIAIKEKYPISEIYWLTKKDAVEIVESSHYVNKAIELSEKIDDKFDLLYNFDIELEATTLAKNIQADEKYGFSEQNGFVIAFNLGAEYYLNTLFDDKLKKTNKKTYQEMMFEVAELVYKRQHHPLYLDEEDKRYAEDFARKNNLKTEELVGIHIGSSLRWPSKAWSKSKIEEFIKKAREESYEILLFGGKDESEKLDRIAGELNKEGITVHKQDPSCSVMQFASLVNLCKVVICPDSLALHVSLALKKPTIALFFCTSPNEIEGYGILKKIISPMLYDFFPEKQDEYSEELVNSISAEEVLKALELKVSCDK